MKHLPKITAILLLFGVAHLLYGTDRAPSSSHERAVLRNGFSLVHDHHEVKGMVTRLYMSVSEETFVDIATDQITGFEKLEPAEEAVLEQPPAPVPTPIAAPQQQSAKNLQQIIQDAANRHNIDADFLASVIAAESGGNPKAVSRKGARGLMQLMPNTASKLGVSNSFDPEANVEAGTKHLRELLALYHNDAAKALAAYNAGAFRVQQYHGVPPYHETRAYVRRIINDFNRKKDTAMRKPAEVRTTSSAPAQTGE